MVALSIEENGVLGVRNVTLLHTYPQNTVLLATFEKLNVRFLFYSLKGMSNKITHRAGGERAASLLSIHTKVSKTTILVH